MSDDQSLPAAPPLSGNEITPGAAAPAPPPVRLAGIEIFVLAVLNLVGIVVAVGSRSRIVDQLHKSSTQLTGSQINAAATVSIAFSVVISVASAALLVWLGVKVLRGRNWARITVTVLLVLGVLSGVYSLVRSGGGVASLVLELVSLVISVTVLVLLWAPAAARAHFARRPTA